MREIASHGPAGQPRNASVGRRGAAHRRDRGIRIAGPIVEFVLAGIERAGAVVAVPVQPTPTGGPAGLLLAAMCQCFIMAHKAITILLFVFRRVRRSIRKRANNSE